MKESLCEDPLVLEVGEVDAVALTSCSRARRQDLYADSFVSLKAVVWY